jgi:DNA-binding CsgD family transcriptional regulator
MMKEMATYDQLLEKVERLEQEASRLRKTEASLYLTERLAAGILHSLSAHIAILNEQGVILETNRAWKEFARANQIAIRPDSIGVNYLALCDKATGSFSEGAREVSDGIRAVIGGKIDEFVIDYPCHSPGQKRWFYMRATKLSGPGPVRVVISHENITALKRTEEALKLREKDLERQTRNLDEVNTALRVLIARREEDKLELEEKVLSNVNELILPYLSSLKEIMAGAEAKAYLEIIESHLDDITSPFLVRLSSKYLHLTPQEIKVATLVRGGKTSKEIAAILFTSVSAVDFHRKNIRKKLGLANKKANLRSHLLTISEG